MKKIETNNSDSILSFDKNDNIITAVVAKANILRNDSLCLTENVCKSFVEQGNKLNPGCFRYDEKTQQVIYTGPKLELIIDRDSCDEQRT